MFPGQRSIERRCSFLAGVLGIGKKGVGFGVYASVFGFSSA